MLGDRTSYWCYYYNNRLGIVYDSAGAGVLNTILVYDLVNQGWTVYQTADPFIAFAALDGTGDPAPTQGVKFNQNNAAQWFWDVNSSGVNTADAWNGTTGTNIAASFQSKYYKVGLPGTPKVLMRWYPEMFASSINGYFNLVNDYGSNTSTNANFTSTSAQAFYDGAGSFVAKYDNGSTPVTNWGTGALAFFGAPGTRQDANLRGEAFSFGFSSTTQLQPWIFQGLTGTYAQHARV
jgi:hypothetical protein